MSVHTPSVGLASQSRPGYTQAWNEVREWIESDKGGWKGRINQARPQTPTAGSLARHGAPESWNHLVPGLGCRTLATPAGSLEQHRSGKHTPRRGWTRSRRRKKKYTSASRGWVAVVTVWMEHSMSSGSSKSRDRMPGQDLRRVVG